MSVSKYINLIACEIEGNWYNMPGCRGFKVANEIGNPVHDGSVKPPKNPIKRFEKILLENKKNKLVNLSANLSNLLMKGEVVSQPLNSMAELSKYMLNYWPDTTNNSCGLHFHVSFNKNGYYSCLMQESFYAFCKEYLKKFSIEEGLNKIFQERFYNETEWARKYCADKFHPEKQVYVNKKIYHDHCPDRYTILNYCYGLHKTLEIRVFSAHMSPKKAIRCAHWWVDCLNKYLDENYESFNRLKLEDNLELELDLSQDKAEVEEILIPEDLQDMEGNLEERLEILEEKEKLNKNNIKEKSFLKFLLEEELA